jgi:hypothetical protein
LMDVLQKFIKCIYCGHFATSHWEPYQPPGTVSSPQLYLIHIIGSFYVTFVIWTLNSPIELCLVLILGCLFGPFLGCLFVPFLLPT